MPEPWYELSRGDLAEALDYAAAASGRPAHLLEKDLWVVWVLSALYSSPLAETLTFKGGTSLSKVYRIIDRFSEDIDLTYDIRALVPDLLKEGEPIPASANQTQRITRAVRKRLPAWINEAVYPVLEKALASNGLQAELRLDDENHDKLIITYPAIRAGTGYVSPTVQLEFGARSTGEPHALHDVSCDIAPWIPAVQFPTATPLVMAVERTFWEKATAAHVFCRQARLRGERYSRHWYDLAAFGRTEHLDRAVSDRQLAERVARHKTMFFAENDAAGSRIDYFEAVRGSLQLVPAGAPLAALESDYAAMQSDGLLGSDQPDFDAVIEACLAIQQQVN